MTREEKKDEIYKLLHFFHKECLQEPYMDKPLLRRERKNRYVDLIYKATINEE